MGYNIQTKLTIVYPVSLCSAQRDLPLFVQGFSSTPQVVPLATFKKRRGEIYGIQHLQIYIYIYIYIGSLCIDFSVLQCSIRRSRARYMLR